MRTPQIVAHRGAWKEYDLPQNSIAALEKSVKIGCQNVELDVHLTADDIIVVNHDHDFYGLVIEDLSYTELCATQHPNGENIPLLDDFLARAKGLSAHLFLEIKSSQKDVARSLQLVQKTLAAVEQHTMKSAVHYISFDQDVMQEVLSLDPTALISYLRGDVEPQQVAANGWSGIDYNQQIFRANPQWIAQASAENILTNVWTVNETDAMQWFLQSGVDFITTDHPAAALELAY